MTCFSTTVLDAPGLCKHKKHSQLSDSSEGLQMENADEGGYMYPIKCCTVVVVVVVVGENLLAF